jgi:hypothetical protein
MKEGEGIITYSNENGDVFRGSFKNDQKNGEGILKGKVEYLKAVYSDGRKNGPYHKTLGAEYE